MVGHNSPPGIRSENNERQFIGVPLHHDEFSIHGADLNVELATSGSKNFRSTKNLKFKMWSWRAETQLPARKTSLFASKAAF
jgi:hypothetical protein